jgi:hypothetical protein
MPVPTIYESGSFRDRSGRVFYDRGEVYRALGTNGLADWSAVVQKTFVQKAMKSGCVVRTETIAGVEAPLSDFKCKAVLRHDVVPIVTWPYEWSFSMLRSAALLTLQLMQEALLEDAILKDGTPYNVQFVGAAQRGSIPVPFFRFGLARFGRAIVSFARCFFIR